MLWNVVIYLCLYKFFNYVPSTTLQYILCYKVDNNFVKLYYQVISVLKINVEAKPSSCRY